MKMENPLEPAQSIKELIEKWGDLYRNVKDGNDTDVRYLKGRDPEWGTYDQHGTNRLRLTYYLFFEQIDDEKTIEMLFREELSDRETNSFQGIGAALEFLTCLLRKYNTDNRYDGLFTRAKEANFDCACGYDKNVEISCDLREYSVFDCISIAVSTEAFDCAEKLVQLWKDSVTDWTEKEYKRLISLNKQIHREADNEEALAFLLAAKRKTGKNRDVISAWNDLISYEMRFGTYEQAYRNFIEMRDHTLLSEIYRINLFNRILENCLELATEYPEKAESLWSWAKPFLEKKVGESGMYGNLYVKGIRAAKAAGDIYAEKLSKNYETWKETMHYGGKKP